MENLTRDLLIIVLSWLDTPKDVARTRCVSLAWRDAERFTVYRAMRWDLLTEDGERAYPDEMIWCMNNAHRFASPPIRIQRRSLAVPRWLANQPPRSARGEAAFFSKCFGNAMYHILRLTAANRISDEDMYDTLSSAFGVNSYVSFFNSRENDNIPYLLMFNYITESALPEPYTDDTKIELVFTIEPPAGEGNRHWNDADVSEHLPGTLYDPDAYHYAVEAHVVRVNVDEDGDLVITSLDPDGHPEMPLGDEFVWDELPLVHDNAEVVANSVERLVDLRAFNVPWAHWTPNMHLI